MNLAPYQQLYKICEEFAKTAGKDETWEIFNPKGVIYVLMHTNDYDYDDPPFCGVDICYIHGQLVSYSGSIYLEEWARVISR
jgi:hypothetical protein